MCAHVIQCFFLCSEKNRFLLNKNRYIHSELRLISMFHFWYYFFSRFGFVSLQNEAMTYHNDWLFFSPLSYVKIRKIHTNVPAECLHQQTVLMGVFLGLLRVCAKEMADISLRQSSSLFFIYAKKTTTKTGAIQYIYTVYIESMFENGSTWWNVCLQN